MADHNARHSTCMTLENVLWMMVSNSIASNVDAGIRFRQFCVRETLYKRALEQRLLYRKRPRIILATNDRPIAVRSNILYDVKMTLHGSSLR
ncbi:hypothetical protein TNCV_4546441 [Trichonephila clavipes]|nr:hypothetical protein TNCV_4546441 [Trichonephila clavipes]